MTKTTSSTDLSGAGAAPSARGDAPVVHGTLRVEREYPASPARVFAAFADQTIKRRWFVEGEAWDVEAFTVDFRVGGRELSRFRFKGRVPGHGENPKMGNDTTYLDIVPDRRIVFAYTMSVGDTRISASLGTVEIAPAGDGARLVYTEQGAFFAGADGPQEREKGWRGLLAALGKELERAR